MPLRTPLCDELSTEVPLFQAGMGNPTGQVAGRLGEHRPAADIVDDFITETERVLEDLR